MKRRLLRILLVFGVVLGVAIVVLGGYAAVQVTAFNRSMDRAYDVAPPKIARSIEPSVVARGKHLAESIGGCASKDCHGVDLGGGEPVDMGPLGVITGPNLTGAGAGRTYTDGDFARVIRFGVKKDGRSLRFMPAQDFAWLPDSDIAALVSYLRSVPAVSRPNGPINIGILAKVLDRRDQVIIDVARRIDHRAPSSQSAPTQTVEYGGLLARACVGCHGDHMSGGPLPGAPSSFAVPANLTPHETGLQGWSFEDFDRLLTSGVKKNGKKLDPFMPYETFSKLDMTEKRALWAYLRNLPPRPFGER